MSVAGKDPKIGILVAVTYGLVAFTTLIAVATYFYSRASIEQGEQADSESNAAHDGRRRVGSDLHGCNLH